MIPSLCPDCMGNELKAIFHNEYTITYECERCSLRINASKDENETIKLLRTPYFKNDWTEATDKEKKIMGNEKVIFT